MDFGYILGIQIKCDLWRTHFSFCNNYFFCSSWSTQAATFAFELLVFVQLHCSVQKKQKNKNGTTGLFTLYWCSKTEEKQTNNRKKKVLRVGIAAKTDMLSLPICQFHVAQAI